MTARNATREKVTVGKDGRKYDRKGEKNIRREKDEGKKGSESKYDRREVDNKGWQEEMCQQKNGEERK